MPTLPKDEQSSVVRQSAAMQKRARLRQATVTSVVQGEREQRESRVQREEV